MISKVIKKGEKSYIELPEELKTQNEIEFFHLKNGFYLISSPAEFSQKHKEKGERKISLDDELLVVSKLMSLKFSERTPASISKILNSEEKEIFLSLQKKKHIWLFKGEKYKKEGVYNISNKLFSLWKEKKSKTPLTPSLVGVLYSQGYLIIEDGNDAKIFSDHIKDQMSSGNILGIRAFDGRYYITTRNFYNKIREKITKEVKESMSAVKISELCEVEKDACLVVLYLMLESGEAIETRKGFFSLI
ncbi:MAG: hypothetical protein WC501_01835 [Candidatus Micrarchaeia archaeon]